MTMRALLEVYLSAHTDRWSDRHAAGDVPDKLPYGLDRLAAFDIEPVWPSRLKGVVGGGARLVAKMSGVRMVEGWVADVRGIDARLCWDERTGIAAALDLRTKKLPVVSGVIWSTAHDSSSRVRALLKYAFGRRRNTLFTLSREQVRTLREMTSAVIEYVPFGIDANFWAADREPDPSGRLVASAGNDRHRDYATLVQGVLGDSSNRLVIGTSAVLPSVRGLTTASLSHRELRGLYVDANVVAVSTKCNDHCSGVTAILEGMSCARPVVATMTPGMDDYIEHDVTGLLVPPNDPTALSAAVRSLLDDPDRARSMGIAGAKRVSQRFTSEHMASSLARLIHEAAAR